jgi:hypothetical protein
MTFTPTLTSIIRTNPISSNLSSVLASTPSINYLRPNSFRFQIAKIPNVTYTCQSANLPSLQLGVANQETPFVDIPHPGDKVSFGEFTIRFLINEDMSNYKELYDWIDSIGVAKSGLDYNKLTNRAVLFDAIQKADQYAYNNVFSDAALLVVDSNNNPVVRLNFEDLFPIAVEGLDFDITTAGMEYFVGVATFRYKIFTIEKLNVPLTQ